MCLPFREGSCIWGGSTTSQVSHWESLQEETQQQRTMQVGSPESQHIQSPTETQTLNTSLNFLSLCLHWKPLGGWTKTSSWHMKLCSAWKLRTCNTLLLLCHPSKSRSRLGLPHCSFVPADLEPAFWGPPGQTGWHHWLRFERS